MPGVRHLDSQAKDAVAAQLRQLLAVRNEVRFACLLGSFLEPGGFRDVDIAVAVDEALIGRDSVLDYELTLSAWLERAVRQPVDVKVVNVAPLAFQYAATGGELLVARDPEVWFEFRERTWRDYLDFAPLAREALADLLRPR